MIFKSSIACICYSVQFSKRRKLKLDQNTKTKQTKCANLLVFLCAVEQCLVAIGGETGSFQSQYKQQGCARVPRHPQAKQRMILLAVEYGRGLWDIYQQPFMYYIHVFSCHVKYVTIFIIYGNILLLYVIYKYVCLVIVTKTRTLALRQWTVKYSTAIQ